MQQPPYFFPKWQITWCSFACRGTSIKIQYLIFPCIRRWWISLGFCRYRRGQRWGGSSFWGGGTWVKIPKYGYFQVHANTRYTFRYRFFYSISYYPKNLTAPSRADLACASQRYTLANARTYSWPQTHLPWQTWTIESGNLNHHNKYSTYAVL